MLLELFKKRDDIGYPPYGYDLLSTLEEKDYPIYLKKIYEDITKEKLNLKNPKTLGEKIQWLKLYDSTNLKSQLTDKILVRDWIKEKIGVDYLKPVLCICENFDDIPFNTLTDAFFIKANNGCKWHFKIKNKKEFLNNKQLYNFVKVRFDNWKIQSFAFWGFFELQYNNIKPGIIIEPVLENNSGIGCDELEVYCFNGKPKLTQKIKYYKAPREISVYDENFANLDVKINNDHIVISEMADDLVREAVKLSEKLAESFKFVRVDWMICNNKLYFNEMTFSPYSGFFNMDYKLNLELGKILNLK